MTNNQIISQDTIISWVNAIYLALEMDNISGEELFAELNIPPEALTDSNFRISEDNITAIFKLAVEATSNPAFGLKVTNYIHPATFHALGYSLFASATIEDFCIRLVRFFPLLTSSAVHHINETEEAFELHIDIINPVTCDETLDAWVAIIIKFCQNIYRPDFAPLAVDLTRCEPVSHMDDFNRYYKAAIKFSAAKNIIYFKNEDVRQPLPAASSELARQNDEVVIGHLAKLEKGDVVRRVEAKIIELLPSGSCNKEDVAASLFMSARSLQNKLERRNTTYKGILDDLRSGLARQYIEQKNMPVSEITYLLGFSDTINFSRAFKRWTGVSPSQYRTDSGIDNS